MKQECVVTKEQEAILTGHQKPILLLDKENDGKLASSVAPGNPKVGVMLPYAPVQLLIFQYDDGIKMPEFLVMFVKLSHHCQRGTANTTHLLAGEAGITLGIAVACYMDTDTDQMFYIGQIVASVALLFFVLITYPYYIKKKVR